MTIRHATPGDASLIADIGARTFRDAFGPDNDPADLALYLAAAFAPETVDAELADPASTFLVAETAETAEPVGYARVVADRPHPALPGVRAAGLARIYVEQAALGTGVGDALMAACLDEAARTGHGAVWLSVWERNPRAIRFYERWGFRAVGETTFTVGTDVQRDVVMARDADARVTPAPAGPPGRA